MIHNDLLNGKIQLFPFDENANKDLEANHVFLIKTDSYFEKIKDCYGVVLSTSELQKADRYLKSKDAESYIVRRYFLRKIIADFLELTAKEIQFQQSLGRKPGFEGIQFNVSHTENLVAIALSSFPVGIDVEFLKYNFNYRTMLEDCFSVSEQLLIQGSMNAPSVFFTLWTRKEALLKASGEGLYDKLNEVDIIQETNTRKGNDYQLFSNVVLDNYMLSVALSSPSKIIHYWTQ